MDTYRLDDCICAISSGLAPAGIGIVRCIDGVDDCAVEVDDPRVVIVVAGDPADGDGGGGEGVDHDAGGSEASGAAHGGEEGVANEFMARAGHLDKADGDLVGYLVREAADGTDQVELGGAADGGGDAVVVASGDGGGDEQ